MSFVWGDKNVEYLTKRYAALQQTTLFQGMKFSTDQNQIKQWAPLIIAGPRVKLPGAFHSARNQPAKTRKNSRGARFLRRQRVVSLM